MPALDGLRGIAVLLVMGYHILVFDESPLLVDPISRVAAVGWMGVDLFFVLSGFLITGILYDTKGCQGFFRNFYVRRFLRIFPLYYAFLAVVCLILPRFLPDDPAKIAQLKSACPWYWSYLANFYMAQHGPGPFNTAHLWSLSVEEQFYLVWPALVFLLQRKNLLQLCVIAIAGAVLCRMTLMHFGASSDTIYVMLPTRVDSIAVGAWIALMLRSPSKTQIPRLAPWVAGLSAMVLLTLLALAPGSLDPSAPFMKTGGYTLNAILFGCVLIMALTSGDRGRKTALESSLLRFFGRHSYALYLVHPFVYGVFKRLALGGALEPLFILPKAVWGVIWVIMNVGVSTLVSVVTWYGLERPFLRLKHRFPSPAATLMSAP